VALRHPFRNVYQAFGCVGTAVEEHILDAFQQVFRHLFVHLELARIDDAHIHSRLDGVVEEGRVYGLAYTVVTTEGKGDVAYPAGYMSVRQVLLDPACRPDEVYRVGVVLFDASGDGKDIRVEDDV